MRRSPKPLDLEQLVGPVSTKPPEQAAEENLNGILLAQRQARFARLWAKANGELAAKSGAEPSKNPKFKAKRKARPSV